MARYDLTRFRTTHNSYSGQSRGSLSTQLDDYRIRCLELDFHDNGYEQFGDYRLGHLKPGMDVATGGGNPDTLLLRDWLGVIAAWSSAHTRHAPLTLVLDIKDDLTDNDVGGDLEDLNQTLEGVFGPRLFTRDQYDGDAAWPDLEDLRGRCLFVLSGDGGTRASYRWAFGSTPAIAINAGGDVVLAYRSTAGDLNCWTGRAEAGGAGLAWRRKATYGFSGLGRFEPVIAINDDRWIVAVDRFKAPPGFPDPSLECRVGRLQDSGRITWFSADTLTAGMTPSLEFEGDDVTEIHFMSDGQRRQQVRGKLNRQKRKIEWQAARATQAPPFPRETVAWQSQRLRCAVDAAGWIGCAFDEGALQPARFRQLAFIEVQKGESPDAFIDALFFAAPANERAAIGEARSRGLVARGWGFDAGNLPSPPNPPSPPDPLAENLPATDGPAAPGYQTYMSGPDVADAREPS